MSAAADGFVVLRNANAGSDEADAIEAVRTVLARYGDVEVAATRSADECGEVCAGLSGRTLVVAGGDGSVHVAVSELDRAGLLADVPIGIVPLGTGNDLARGLGLPLEPADAAEVVANGEPRRLDLITDDDGGLVVNAVHLGVGAEAALHASNSKDRLGPLAYPVGALVAAVRGAGWELTVRVDGQPVWDASEPVLMVGIANAPTIGGGTPLCPPADPSDGALDVVVVGAVGPAARSAFGLALQRGEHLERDDVVHHRGHEVEVTGEPVRANADGEVSEPAARRRYGLRPAAWSVLTGRPSPTS